MASNVQINPSLSALQNFLALVDSQNPLAPSSASQVTTSNLTTLTVGSVSSDPTANTSVEIDAASGQTRYTGSVVVYYAREAVSDQISAVGGSVSVPYGSSSAAILSLVATHYGFIPSEISWVSAPTAPGTLPGTGTGTIQTSGSLVYTDGTGTVNLSWAAQSYQAVVLSDAPYAYYPLTDASGTTATDLSGNARNGTYNGAVSLAASAFMPTTGKSYAKLPGANTAYVDVTAAKNFCSTTTWSIECWINVTSYSQANIATSGTGCTLLSNANTSSPTAGLDWTLSLSQTNKFWYWPAASKDIYSAANAIPAVGARAHLVLTYNAGTLTTYMNGAVVGSASTSVTNATVESVLQIGAQSWTGGAFNGSIGEVALYNKALTAARVLAHYNAG